MHSFISLVFLGGMAFLSFFKKNDIKISNPDNDDYEHLKGTILNMNIDPHTRNNLMHIYYGAIETTCPIKKKERIRNLVKKIAKLLDKKGI